MEKDDGGSGGEGRLKQPGRNRKMGGNWVKVEIDGGGIEED